MSISISLISLFTGSIVGILKSYLDNHALLQQKQLELLAKDKIQNRESTNKFYQWTRRIIALSLIVSIITYPIIAVLLNIPIYMPFIESHGFFASIFYGESSTEFKVIHGLVLPPIVIPATMYILGFYFSSPTKRL